MNLNTLQASFAGGEISPNLQARVDLQRYATCLKTAKNFLVHPQGGASNRAGTYYVCAAKYRDGTDKKVRLVPFVFGADQSYILEFGDGYLRVIAPGGQVLNADGTPYEIASPYAGADLDLIQTDQDADVLYIACKTHPPYTLARYGHDDWRFARYDFKEGPFKLLNIDPENPVTLTYDNGLYTLYTFKENLTQGHVPGLFKIVRTVEAHTINYKYTITHEPDVAGPVICGGQWNLRTFGTWAGAFVLEYSKDLSIWKNIRTFKSASDANFDTTGEVPEGLCWVRIRRTEDFTAGPCNICFNAMPFEQTFIFKATDFVNANTLRGTILNEVADLHTFFKPTGTAKEYLTAVMTSNTTQNSGDDTPLGTAFLEPNDATASPVAWKSFSRIYNNAAFIPTAPAHRYKLGYRFPAPVLVNSVTISGLSQREKTVLRVWGKTTDYILLAEMDLTENTDETVTVPLTPRIIKEFALSVDATHGGLSGFAVGQIKISGLENTTDDYITNWAKGAWSESEGWPTSVCVFENRVCWATGHTIDATRTGQPDNFGTSSPLTDSDGISTSAKDNQINQINTLIGINALIAFTSGGEFASDGNGLTPNNCGLKKQTFRGGAAVRPVLVGNRVVFAQALGGIIRDLAYNFEQSGYDGDDLRVWARHLFDGKTVKALAYQQEPDSLLWALTTDGNLYSLTYLPAEQVYAWTRTETAGNFESVAVIPGAKTHELYAVVNRSGRRFIEKFAARETSTDPKEQLFLDCAITYRGAEADVITGLEHLEGFGVGVLADGNVVNGCVVRSGQITLPVPAKVVHVGLRYECELETLSAEAQTGNGTLQAQKGRIVKVRLKLLNTRGGKFGTDPDRMEELLQRTNEPYNTPARLFTGDTVKTVSGAYGCGPGVIITQNEPLPITVLAVIATQAVGG